MSVKKYENNIYAGVLGKILGVYLGRPVEGWGYKKRSEERRVGKECRSRWSPYH